MRSVLRCWQRSIVVASSAACLRLLIFPGMMHGCTVVDRRHMAAVVHGEMTELLLFWHDCSLLWIEWMNEWMTEWLNDCVLGKPCLYLMQLLDWSLCDWVSVSCHSRGRATTRVLPVGSWHSGVERAISELCCSGCEGWCYTQRLSWAM
jgi:hypothetical protein